MKNSQKIKPTIAVIGLGYVGLPLGIALSKRYNVTGFDIDNSRIKSLKNFNDETGEITSKKLKSSKNIKFTNSIKALTRCNVYIITVPTPIDKSNIPDLYPLQSATEMIGKSIKKGDLVIYESTVYPGCTEEFCVPILEENSQLRYNVDFYCGYSPERINPGDKVHTITKIKKVVSGSNEHALKMVTDIYKSIISAGIFKAASIKVAEAAKVIENSQRDLNIAFVNELSHIFRLLEIDTYDVLEAAQTKWNFLPFQPGLVGGHCISVDPYYLTYKAQALGYNPQVLLSGRRINDNFAYELATTLIKNLNSSDINPAKAKIGIFGVTFKENCPDTRNSKVFNFIRELSDWGSDIYFSDPFVNHSELPESFQKIMSELKLGQELDVICVMVPHDVFLNLSIGEYKEYCLTQPNPVFFDLKSRFDREILNKNGFKVIRT